MRNYVINMPRARDRETLYIVQLRHEPFVVQWWEHQTGWSNFCQGLRFFSLSRARDMLITSFLISSPSLKSIVFLKFFYLKSWCFCWLVFFFSFFGIVQCLFGLLYYVRANNDKGLTLETSPFQTLFSVVVIRVNKEIHKTSSMSWFLYHRVGSIDLIPE